MKRSGWILGIVLLSLINLLLLIALPSALDTDLQDDGSLSSVEAMALTRRASELYCAGIYHTDLALSADPEQVSHEDWRNRVDRAETYWSALAEVVAMLETGIDDHTFDDMSDKAMAAVSGTGPAVSALDGAAVLRKQLADAGDR